MPEDVAVCASPDRVGYLHGAFALSDEPEGDFNGGGVGDADLVIMEAVGSNRPPI